MTVRQPGTPSATHGRAFAGFATTGPGAIIPSAFFTRVLPELEAVEELVVSLYFFYAASQVRRSPRFLARRELAADATLLRSLARLCGGADHEALARGLELAVRRGTLFRVAVRAGERDEELLAVNTPANRRALGALDAARLAAVEPLPPALAEAAPNIFVLYEENVGGITPLIAEDLKEAEERYPAAWILEAFREAVEMNKRSWRYIERILRRWETEGPDYEEAGRDPQSEWLERRYREGKRRGRPLRA